MQPELVRVGGLQPPAKSLSCNFLRDTGMKPLSLKITVSPASIKCWAIIGPPTPFRGGTSFEDILCFFCLVFATCMPLCASVYMCLVVTCWERAGLLALVCGVKLLVCHFTIGILGQVWYLIVSIPDICTLTYSIEMAFRWRADDGPPLVLYWGYW